MKSTYTDPQEICRNRPNDCDKSVKDRVSPDFIYVYVHSISTSQPLSKNERVPGWLPQKGSPDAITPPQYKDRLSQFVGFPC